MGKNTSGFTKTALSVLTFGILPLLNLQSLFFPVLASYGGQWARTRRGRGDAVFYPRTNLYPWDMLIYLALFMLLIWMIYKAYTSKKPVSAIKMYLIISALPFIWAVSSLIVGFNYEACNLPSKYFTCQNPSGRIFQRLIMQMIVVFFTLLTILLMTKALAKKNVSKKV